MADPYTVLGVAKDATEDQIRAAYRKLAKEHHPDLNPGNAKSEARFKEIAAAYDILGDPGKRKRFDAGEIDASGAEQPERRFYRQYAGAQPNFKYERRSEGESFEDLGDIFSDLFARRDGGRTVWPGRDARYSLAVDFLEAVNGTRKRATMPDGRTFDIDIPAGLRDGQTLRLQGQGLPGAGGGPPGDALIAIEVRPHPVFRREGNDIRSRLPVTLAEALAGATVPAATVSGRVNLKVPPRSSTGTVLRLRGKGVPDQRGGGRGDHLIELEVVLPPAADAELEQFVADWEARHPYDPRQPGGGRT
jgi:DnaJ-class molecular chaperone